jgi:hypothetical protein
LLLAAAFGLALYLLAADLLPLGALLVLGGLPLGFYAARIALREYNQRSLVRANAATIQLHLVSGLLMVAGLLLSPLIAQWIGV